MAYLEEYGPEYEIEADFVEYASEDERLAAAFADNIAHGLKPTKKDEERVMRLLAMTYGWPVSRLSRRLLDPAGGHRAAHPPHGRDPGRQACGDSDVYEVRRPHEGGACGPGCRHRLRARRDGVEPERQPDQAEVGGAAADHRAGARDPPWQIVRQVADWSRLPEEFWPDATPQLLEHLDEAIEFLTLYGERLSEEEENEEDAA